MREGRYHEAVLYLEDAHNTEPENNFIKANLSVAYHHFALEFASKKDYLAAIGKETQALSYAPKNENIRKQLSIFFNNLALEYAQKQRYDIARDYLKDALKYTPEFPDVIANLYNIILKDAEYCYKNQNSAKALSMASEAVSILPGRAAAYIFAGNIYYEQDDFDNAEEYWNSALKIEPENQILKERIEKLNKEEIVEGDFKTRKRQHFRMRFDRKLSSEYVWDMIEILEDARIAIRNEFNLDSDEVIPVIVYSDEQFNDATSQPDWTIGVYDGKIRVRIDYIREERDALERVLYHEYGHAVLYLNYGANIPLWLHEGFAQYCEPGTGNLTKEEKLILSDYVRNNNGFDLKGVDESIGQKENDCAIRIAYLESKLFFGYLMDKYGKYKLKRLLEKLKEREPWEQAVSSVYGRKITRLEKEFNEYLVNIAA